MAESMYWGRDADGEITFGLVLRVQAKFQGPPDTVLPADEISDVLLERLEQAVADVDDDLRRNPPLWNKDNQAYWPATQMTDDGIADMKLAFVSLESSVLPVPLAIALTPLDVELEINDNDITDEDE